MTEPNPDLRPERLPEDTDRALRPQMLAEFIGQAEARANLAVFIESARMRGEASSRADPQGYTDKCVSNLQIPEFAEKEKG